MKSRMRVSAKVFCTISALCAAASAVPASSRTLYVSANGLESGNGTRAAPFRNLPAVEQASKPGDTIVVLAVPIDVPALEGGIALKDGQKLIGDGPKVTTVKSPLTSAARITNATQYHNGDAIVMANKTSVSNLVILDARRSGIYLKNVTGVSVAGNVLSASNTSCTPARGFEGQIFVGRPMHGYAAVMADYELGTADFSVIGNQIHDGLCMDGIHIRAGGNSDIKGRIDQNIITRLQQGNMFVSVLGIALETKDSASLTVTSDGNTQTFIGNPVGGVPTADCEGLLGHQTGGELHWAIARNYFAHAMGGSSCNGAEFFITEGNAKSTISISDSTFLDAQGDMVQNINLGTGETALTMERVTISHTRLATEPGGPPESRGSNPAGNEAGRPRGHCLLLVTQGSGGTNRARISGSEFSNCSGDGVFMFHAPFLGLPGGSREQRLEIDQSTITTEQGYGLRWANYGSIERASVKVRNSFFSGALDKAAIALVQNPSDAAVKAGTFDFGTTSDPGGNCIGLPGPKAVEIAGMDATFVGNFWGANIANPQPGTTRAPMSNTLTVSGGQIDTRAPLGAAPATCGRM